MTDLALDVWTRAQALLRERVVEDEFTVWIEPIQCERFDAGRQEIVLSVASEFYQRWITRKHLDTIREAVGEAIGTRVNVTVEVRRQPLRAAGNGNLAEAQPRREMGAQDDAPGRLEARAPARGAEAQQGNGAVQGGTPRAARLNPRYTFREFVVGESNRFAHAAAQSMASPNAQGFNPVFIYGQSGLGKTHLMQAVGHANLQRDPGLNVLYATSEHFINSFIESIHTKKSTDFRQMFRTVDILLLDDVQFLMGKERTQDELFHTFNALFDAGKKIVLTSDRPPRDLSTLEDRLRSRFEWGVIADMQPPDLETRIAILRHKTRQEGVVLNNEVVAYIAENVTSNIRELEGALKRIKVYAGLHDRPITVDAARDVLGHLVVGQNQNRVTVEGIQRAVCEYFSITTEQLRGSNRAKRFSQPRHIAFFLCRELTDNSFPDIAQKFGGKDHTSVIYAYRKIKKLMGENSQMDNVVNYLRRQIEQNHST